MEFGAIRNFESVRLAEIQAEKEAKKEKEEEENNPMKVLENRTRDSRREMANLEALEDLRELNAANASVDPKIILEEEAERKRKLEEIQIEEDEEEIRRIFHKDKPCDIELGIIEEEVIDQPIKKLKAESTIVSQFLIIKNITKNFKQKLCSIKDVKQEAQDPKLEQPKSTSVLFKRPFLPTATNSKNMDTKSKISSLIKKKPETEAKTPVSAPPLVNPLASLASYSSDESENDE